MPISMTEYSFQKQYFQRHELIKLADFLNSLEPVQKETVMNRKIVMNRLIKMPRCFPRLTKDLQNKHSEKYGKSSEPAKRRSTHF